MIQKEQLESILELNKSIDAEVSRIVEQDLIKYSVPSGNIAGTIFYQLKDICEIIQLPINDDKLGGFMLKKKGNFYCFINTNQTRAFQDFVCLHEFYHLKHDQQDHDIISNTIEHEISIQERKANYYASLMLLDKEMLRKHFYHFRDDRKLDLITTICHLMSLFRTTYKTILIRLFEIGCITDFTILYENFNADKQMIYDYFSKIGLDKSIIEPSRVQSVGNLKIYIENTEQKGTMLQDMVDQNKKYYKEILKKLHLSQEE